MNNTMLEGERDK